MALIGGALGPYPMDIEGAFKVELHLIGLVYKELLASAQELLNKLVEIL